MSDTERGLYEKFSIDRRDGSSDYGKKHFGCKYFVLDLNHDVYAIPALEAYAIACAPEYPVLALEIHKKLVELRANLKYTE